MGRNNPPQIPSYPGFLNGQGYVLGNSWGRRESLQFQDREVGPERAACQRNIFRCQTMLSARRRKSHKALLSQPVALPSPHPHGGPPESRSSRAPAFRVTIVTTGGTRYPARRRTGERLRPLGSAQAPLSPIRRLWNRFTHWAATSCLPSTQSIRPRLQLEHGQHVVTPCLRLTKVSVSCLSWFSSSLRIRPSLGEPPPI